MKWLSQAIVALGIIALPACSSGGDDSGSVYISKESRNISVGVSSIDFGATDNLTSELRISAENTGWATSISAPWVSISPSQGKGSTTTTVTASENKSVDEPRVATLNIHSTESDYQWSKDIAIAQSAAMIYITPSESSLSFNATASSRTVGISSNVDWEVESSHSWATVNKLSSSQIEVSVSENLSATRQATISLRRAGTSTVVTKVYVTQSEAGVTADVEKLYFLVDGETQTVQIEADASWEAYTPSGATWYSVSPNQGTAGTHTLSITALANPTTSTRDGFVYVKIGSSTKLSIPIHQYDILISTTTESLNFDSNAGTKTFSLYANTNWEVVSAPDWLSVSPISGAANPATEISVTVEDNPNTTSRTGKIVVGRTGLTDNDEVVVTQEGKNFSLADDYLHFTNAASTQYVQVATDGNWQASTDSPWISVSDGVGNTAGSGSFNLGISVEANAEQDERRGIVTITVGETTKRLTVVQDGRYLNITCNDLLKTSTPTTISLSVASNTDWTAASDVAWMTVSPKNGSGDAEIKVAVADNPSMSERSGGISVTNIDGTKIFSITQPGRTLTTDCVGLEFISTGGTSDAIVVTTDGQYCITTSDSWISVQESGNTFTVTVSENESKEIRTGTVIIELTDLANGETFSRTIPIKQVPQYVSIGLKDFGEDENWNL